MLRRPRWAVLIGLIFLLLAAGAFLGGRLLLFEHHLRAARAALEEQDCDEARPHIDACLRLRPESASVHFVAARGLRRAGFYDEAEEHLRAWERLAGQTPDTLLEWAMLGAARGDLPTYEEFLLARLDEGVPQGGLILEALIQGSIDTYHLERVRYYLGRLLEREPDSALGLMWQGWLYETSGRTDSALENCRRAVRAHPRQPAVRLRLAQLAVLLNQPAEAEEHLDNLRRRGYRRPQVLLALARCRTQEADPAGARRLLDELLDESPDNSEALLERGKLALQEGDPAAAERPLRRAVELVPQDRQALNSLVQALSQQGNTREGEEFAARLRKMDEEMKRLEEVYKKINAAPNDVSLRHAAAVICLRNGQDREAQRWLTGALQLDPDYAPAHESLAECYERAGQPDLAAEQRRLAAAGARPAGQAGPGRTRRRLPTARG